jgi:hypothetical protein
MIRKIKCKIQILKITQEVPYFMYRYDLFRDTPIDRQQWITVKVERGALVRDRKIVNEINAICQERGYQRVVTPQGTLFRMPKA